MSRERLFTVTRSDMDGFDSAVTIELELEHAPTAVASSFDAAKADLITQARALLAAAEALEEPDPTPWEAPTA